MAGLKDGGGDMEVRDYCCHLNPSRKPGLVTAPPSERKSHQISAFPRTSSHLWFMGQVWDLLVSLPPTRGGGGRALPQERSRPPSLCRLLLLTPCVAHLSVAYPVFVPKTLNTLVRTAEEKMEALRCQGTWPRSQN